MIFVTRYVMMYTVRRSVVISVFEELSTTDVLETYFPATGGPLYGEGTALFIELRTQQCDDPQHSWPADKFYLLCDIYRHGDKQAYGEHWEEAIRRMERCSLSSTPNGGWMIL